jgi:hypothetical protein
MQERVMKIEIFGHERPEHLKLLAKFLTDLAEIPPQTWTLDEPAAPAEPAITLEQLRDLLKRKSDEGKRKEVQDLIASYKVKNLTQLDEKQYHGAYIKGEQL